MKSRKMGFIVAAVSALMCVCLFGFTSKSQTTAVMDYGPEVNGLRLSLSLAGAGKGDSPVFLVTLYNAGDKDVMVNLGAIVGQFQSPNAVGLSVEDDAGNIKELHFVDTRYSGVAGRMDNYVVPLKTGDALCPCLL